MRVLDVGSGTGAVAFLAADLVGPTGEVIGTDLDRRPLRRQARPPARALSQVSFREGDPAEMAFDRTFDAIVGRYVLMFQADASRWLRRLAGHLRPGGVIVFHEPDWSCGRSDPVAPTYDRCCRWVIDALDRAGTSPI